MSIVKRISATIHASVDRTVASIENHDAIIQATLSDSRRAVATARVRLTRVQAETQRQEKHIADLENRTETWTTRAKSIGETDRDKALRCLEQRKNDQEQLEKALETLMLQRDMQQRVQTKVESLEKRVTQLQRQHTEMRSRDTVARATTQVHALEHGPSINIDDTFDRWEVSIRERELQSEISSSPIPSSSTLDEELTANENKELLSNELDDLLNNKE